MKKLLNLMLIAVVMTAFTFPGFADEKYKHKSKEMKTLHKKKGKCSLMADLNLTEKQRDEINKLKKVYMETKKKQTEKTKDIHKKTHDLMNLEKLDKKSIYKMIDESGKLFVEMKKMRFDYKLKLRAILTPVQLKKFTEMKSKYSQDLHHKQKTSCSHGKKKKGYHKKEKEKEKCH